jgi:hypothetical protein
MFPIRQHRSIQTWKKEVAQIPRPGREPNPSQAGWEHCARRVAPKAPIEEYLLQGVYLSYSRPGFKPTNPVSHL